MSLSDFNVLMARYDALFCFVVLTKNESDRLDICDNILILLHNLTHKINILSFYNCIHSNVSTLVTFGRKDLWLLYIGVHYGEVLTSWANCSNAYLLAFDWTKMFAAHIK